MHQKQRTLVRAQDATGSITINGTQEKIMGLLT